MTAYRLIVAVILLPFASCDFSSKTVFSSRASPNGAFIAESVAFGVEGNRAELIITSKNSSIWREELGESAPDIFLRWVDDLHLEIWRDIDESVFHSGHILGDIQITRRSCRFPINDANIYNRPNLSIRRVTVPIKNVIAQFSSTMHDQSRRCVLKVSTAPDRSYERAMVEINAVATNSCRHTRPCAEISTVFTLEHDPNSIPQTVLTSATISDIPSYNRLPTGDSGTSVRGQFSEQSAAALMDALKTGFVELEFSENFFDQVIVYNFDLSNNPAALDEFSGCVSSTDFLWMRH